MSSSWWDFGEGYGQWGDDLALYQIECPFCEERGNYKLKHREESVKPNDRKVLYFDTYQCARCANNLLVFWSPSSGGKLHNFLQVPYAKGIEQPPEYWPEEVALNWVECHKCLQSEAWNACVNMARTSLQAALRDKGAKKGDLIDEIRDIQSKGLIPPLMVDWAHEIRKIGNDSTHPEKGYFASDADDGRDVTDFLDQMLGYLYDMPEQIKKYRSRREKKKHAAKKV